MMLAWLSFFFVVDVDTIFWGRLNTFAFYVSRRLLSIRLFFASKATEGRREGGVQ